MQRYSKLFGKTQREAKSGMTASSHKLLYRGGFIRELSAGRYEMLPLGMRVFNRLVNLIEREMQAVGSQQVVIPLLQPIEIWKKTNRDTAWGEELMKIKDSRGAEFALSATGEGVITEMVAETNPTYKDLPIIVHQFIEKFRDEKRARGGLIRVREFVMKDAYSYHETEEDFMKTYNDFYNAYSNICKKLDLTFYPCIADSGALGGDYCHEFQVPCEAGEDKIVKCSSCDYAANIEKAEFVREISNPGEELKDYEEVALPYDVAKIKDLIKHYNLPADRFIKNVVYKTPAGKLVIATVTGNLDVNPKKLTKAVNESELELATDEDLASIGAKSGFVQSWGYKEYKDKIIFVADEGITIAINLYGGYKTDTTDPINVNYGRDFEADIVADIADPIEGSKCKACGGTLNLIKTIEFGHIFKYDHFYTKHHDGYYTDKDGKKKLMYMGAYGIGIGRAIAVAVENHNDDKGISWPESIAPYDVHLVTLGNISEEDSLDLIAKLESIGREVLWDDRLDTTAGEKFADADLIGIPIRIVLSERSLKNGGVEVKKRSETEGIIVSLDKVIEYLK